MSVTIASLDDIEAVVVRLLDDRVRPLVVRPTDAARMLGISVTGLNRLVREGHLQPVPHLSPTRYSVAVLEQFVSGSTGTGVGGSSSVSRLPQRPPRAGGRTGSNSTGDAA